MLHLARRHGMRLAIENTKRHAEKLVRLVQSIAEKDLGFCLDTGHAFLGDDLEYCVSEMNERLFIVHAQDTPGKESGDVHLPPFCGGIAWESIAPRLGRQKPLWDFEVALLDRGGSAEDNLSETFRACAHAKTKLLKVTGAP